VKEPITTFGPVSSVSPEGVPWLLIPGGSKGLVVDRFHWFRTGRTKRNSLCELFELNSAWCAS
jgi:hypothetical protein